MHVNVLEVQNYMKVDAYRIDAQGNHVIISAANDSGKSSVVNALYDGIQGVNVKLHPDPVRHGADKAIIRIDTTVYHIERQIKPDGKSSLVVKTADGKKVAGMTPHKLLTSLISEYSLDPVQFFNQREQDQIDDVLRVCGVKPPVDKVTAITGETIQPLPDETADKYLERLSADNTGVYYLKRRMVNQEVEVCRGAVEKQDQLLASLKLPDAVLRPIENIMADIETCNEAAAEGVKEKQVLTDLEKLQAEYEKQFNDIKSQIVQLGKDRTRYNAEIAAIHDQIEAHQDAITKLKQSISDKNQTANDLTAEIHRLTTRMENGSNVIDEHLQVINEQKAKIAALPDVESNRKIFTDELKQTQKMQEEQLRYNHALERHQELSKSHDDSKRRHTALDICLDRLRDLRRNLLNDVDLGIDGLSIGEGELLLNGVSFKQASSAQRLTVAFCIAIKGNPVLKLIRIDNGELLDETSQAHLLKLASDNGYQVIMTRVSNDKGLSVQIIDR